MKKLHCTMFSACPEVSQALMALGPYVGANTPEPHPPAHETDKRDVDRAMHGRVLGLFALFGIGGYEEMVAQATRSLLSASHSHECVVVVTADAYSHLQRQVAGMHPIDRGYLRNRVAAAILVGDESSFADIKEIFPAAKTMGMSDLDWTMTSCTVISEDLHGVFKKQLSM